MRIYELTFIVDPRVSDEDVVQLTNDYKKMIEDGGGTILRVDNSGRRKLAYSIQKLTEGKYVLLYIGMEDQLGGTNPLPGLELRLKQNDKILRYLTVRTDRPVEPEEEAGQPDTEGADDAREEG
jgi:small subunit ribosomal protein S6